MMLDCDLLTVYSKLCMSMPDMEECDMWKTMCLEIPDWPLCTNDDPHSKLPPQMRMYFHTGIVDYILFQGWVPRTTGFYIGSWFVIFFASILAEILKLVRSLLERRWKQQEEAMSHIIRHSGHKGQPDELETMVNHEGPIEIPAHKYLYNQMKAPFRITADLPRSILQTLEVGWGLLIMLIAMTFNVGLFLAILAGTFVGTMLVGRFFTYEAKANCH